jgi:putative transposase
MRFFIFSSRNVVARDFNEFIRISGMTHVRTSPNYPQSNGKLERWHKSLKSECIRPGTPLSLEDAKRLIQQYVDRYNDVRLHSGIEYVTPNDMLAGRQVEIHTERDRRLEAARHERQSRRQPSCVKKETASCRALASIVGGAAAAASGQ